MQQPINRIDTLQEWGQSKNPDNKGKCSKQTRSATHRKIPASARQSLEVRENTLAFTFIRHTAESGTDIVDSMFRTRRLGDHAINRRMRKNVLE